MKKKYLDEIFPIYEIDDDGVVFTKNGDPTLVFEITYPEIFVTAENQYTETFESFFNATRSLGEGFMVHKQDFFFEDRYKPDFSYNLNGDEVIHANEMHFKDRPFNNHKGFLYISYPSSSPLKRTSAASSLFKGNLMPKTVRDRSILANLKERAAAYASTINQTKTVGLRLLGRNEIVGTKEKPGLLNYYFSLSFDDLNIYDIDRQNANFKVANKNTFTFLINDLDQFPNEVQSVVGYREFSSPSATMPISYGTVFGMNLPFNHIYNQVFYIPPQQQLMTEKQAEIKRHNSFASFSKDNQYSRDSKDAFLDTLKMGEVAVKAHFNIVIFHEDQNVLNGYKDITSGAITNSQFASKIASSHSEQLFWSCIPGNSQELGVDNFATISLSNAVSLYSLETNYRHSPYQPNGLLVTDRFGLPRILDLFFEPMKSGLIQNRNFSLIGPSGSGKSFKMNNFFYYFQKSGAHITIVDIGHSYKRLGQTLGAKYIEHSEENPISLNPFYVNINTSGLDKSSTQKLTDEFQQVIVQILLILYKTDGEKVTKAEDVTLLLMVNEYYKFISEHNAKHPKGSLEYIRMCFDSFYEFSKAQFPEIFLRHGGSKGHDFDLDQFWYVLSPYYKGGQFDYLLNGADENALAAHPFVIYELDNIKDHPILLPIITLMITNTYITKLLNPDGILKILVIEEAWKAISSEFFATFLLWAFKTARKHFGSIGVVTQEIQDLLKSPIIQETIVNNTDIKIIMDIKKYEENPEYIFDLFKISKSNIPQIFSINKELPHSLNRGRYKETAIIIGKQCKIYGIEVSRQAYALFTTEPSEVSQIKRIATDRGLSFKEAALAWAEETA